MVSEIYQDLNISNIINCSDYVSLTKNT